MAHITTAHFLGAISTSTCNDQSPSTFTASSFFAQEVIFASLLLSDGSELSGAAGWVALAAAVEDVCAAFLEAYIHLHLLRQAPSPFL